MTLQIFPCEMFNCICRKVICILPHLLLKNAKFAAGITRRKHAVDTRVLKELPSFFIMSMHDAILHLAIFIQSHFTNQKVYKENGICLDVNRQYLVCKMRALCVY